MWSRFLRCLLLRWRWRHGKRCRRWANSNVDGRPEPPPTCRGEVNKPRYRLQKACSSKAYRCACEGKARPGLCRVEESSHNGDIGAVCPYGGFGHVRDLMPGWRQIDTSVGRHVHHGTWHESVQREAADLRGAIGGCQARCSPCWLHQLATSQQSTHSYPLSR